MTGLPPVRVVITGEAGSVVAASQEASVAMATMRTRINGDIKAIETETTHMSHSALIGIGEVVRGFGRIGATGEASAFAIRELSGGAARLGAVLGPAGGLAGIVVLLGGAFYEMFEKAQKGMEKTRIKFAEEIGKMANDSDFEQLNKQARDVWSGTPFDEKGHLRGPAAGNIGVGAFAGSLIDLRERMRQLKSELKGTGFFVDDVTDLPINKAIKALQPQLDAAEQKFAAIQRALDLMRSRPATIGILPMKSEAPKPEDFVKEWEESVKHTRAMMDQMIREGNTAEEEVLKKRISQELEAAHKSLAIWHEEGIKLKAEREKNARDFLTFVKELDTLAAENAAAAVKKIEEQWIAFFGIARNAIDKSIQGIIQGTLTMKQAWANLFRSMTLEAISAEAKMLAAHAAHWLARKQISVTGVAQEIALESWAALKFIALEAAKAAAAAWAWASSKVDPFTAAAIGFGTLAAVLALGSSIGGGSSSSGGSAGAPASRASASQVAPSAGSNGPTTIIIQAMDSQSLHSYLMANAPTVARATMEGARQGVRLPNSPGRG